MDKVTGEARIALMSKKDLETDLLEEILSWMPKDKNCKSPIAEMYRREIPEIYEDIKNNDCYCEGGCDCQEDILQWVSKAKSLFSIQHYYNATNHKFETMIDWLRSKIDTTETSKQKLLREWKRLQKSYPMFCHCNNDMIYTCLKMLNNHRWLNLNNYEELYDQLY